MNRIFDVLAGPSGQRKQVCANKAGSVCASKPVYFINFDGVFFMKIVKILVIVHESIAKIRKILFPFEFFCTRTFLTALIYR